MLKFFRRIYSSKDVILRLAFTDLKTKYVGSRLGILWSLLEPLLVISMLSIVFPAILKADFSEWFLFFICGLIPYRFFRKSIMEMTTCLKDYSDILEKSRTNAENVVLAKAVSGSVSFLIELLIIFVLVSIFVPPSLFIFLLIPLFLINVLMNLGFGMYFSVLYPKMRDIGYILNVFLEIFMFLTPVVYRLGNIPSLYRGVYMLNPISRLIYTYQGIFLYSSPKFVEYLPIWREMIILFLFALVIFIIGYKKFEKEKRISLELV